MAPLLSLLSSAVAEAASQVVPAGGRLLVRVAGSEQEESSLAFLSPRNFDSFWEGIWCAAAAPDASHQQEQAPAEACQILVFHLRHGLLRSEAQAAVPQ